MAAYAVGHKRNLGMVSGFMDYYERCSRDSTQIVSDAVYKLTDVLNKLVDEDVEAIVFQLIEMNRHGEQRGIDWERAKVAEQERVEEEERNSIYDEPSEDC